MDEEYSSRSTVISIVVTLHAFIVLLLLLVLARSYLLLSFELVVRASYPILL